MVSSASQRWAALCASEFRAECRSADLLLVIGPPHPAILSAGLIAWKQQSITSRSTMGRALLSYQALVAVSAAQSRGYSYCFTV